MRIASPRPLTAASPVGLLLIIALAVAAVVVASITLTMWRSHGAGASDRHEAAVTMADAFGLGGLASLPRPASARSPAVHDTIVTYYGSPRAPSMGILGQHDPEDAADLLAARAQHFEALDAGSPVLPAIHLVYAVAQRQTSGDGSDLQYLDDRAVRQYIALARRRGFVLILDIQIGHSDALAEIRKIVRYLDEPDVFVALDPEFALSGNVKPGDAIGSIDAADINAVQWYLAAFAAQRHLPPKMLIVHQFQAEMITNAASIERRGGVDLVVDMDGYGPADIKEVRYGRFGAASYARFGGIKIFLQHDPDPLTEAQLLGITPRPSLFVYQ